VIGERLREKTTTAAPKFSGVKFTQMGLVEKRSLVEVRLDLQGGNRGIDHDLDHSVDERVDRGAG
jgi:hypothetical protein